MSPSNSFSSQTPPPPDLTLQIGSPSLVNHEPETDKSTPVEISISSPDLVTDNPSAAFVPNPGAWAKPLKFNHTDSSVAVRVKLDSTRHDLSHNWPSLGQTRKRRESNTPDIPQMHIPAPTLKDNGTLRFPWAAKTNQETRNLFRTTSPTYLPDGTPKVIIPNQILLHGPENQKEYVIGQFYQCVTPSGGLVHAIVNRIWGRNCKIFSRKLGVASYLFHVPDASTRSWILERGLWHVDGCLMFVAPWSPSATLSLPEISSAPVWVTLKNIPDGAYSRWGISQIASGLGEPILTSKPRLDPTMLGEAKILVEIELDKPFPQRIACEDEMGVITMVEVVYSWIPTKCDMCGHLGHKESRCLQQKLKGKSQVLETSLDSVVAKSAPAFVSNLVSDSSIATDSITEEVIVETEPNLSIVVVDHVHPASITTPTNEAPNASEVTATTQTTQVTPLIIPAGAISEFSSDVQNEDDVSTPTHQKDGGPTVSKKFDLGGLQSSFLEFESKLESARTRGGRSIKPTQKVLENEWKTVGKGGRRPKGGH